MSRVDRTERPSVLFVDDETELHDLVLCNMRDAGFEASAVATGVEALRRVETGAPEVVVLDLMLPDTTGIQVCRRIRDTPAISDTGVLMLTARDDEYDRFLGFEAGADDYVTKPFGLREFIMRVDALARRVRHQRSGEPAAGARHLSWGGIHVDTGRREVTIEGTVVTLRPLEYGILVLLLRRVDKTFRREELVDAIWGQGAASELQPRAVDTQIRRLRGRLGAHGAAIEAVHGVGYRLRREPRRR